MGSSGMFPSCDSSMHSQAEQGEDGDSVLTEGEEDNTDIWITCSGTYLDSMEFAVPRRYEKCTGIL